MVNTLPQLEELDGQKIEKSERLKSAQLTKEATESILEDSRQYADKRKKQKIEFQLKEVRGEVKIGDEFWNEVEEDSPESRIQMHLERRRQKQQEDERKPMFEKPNYKRTVKYFNSEGEPVNVNQAGLDFALEEEESNQTTLRLFLPKFLDTEFIDVDAQPQYIRNESII